MKKEIDYEILGAEALVAKDYKDLKEIKGSLDILNKVINEKNVENIGITGGYGVGKTTFLNTFIHYYVEKVGNIKKLFDSKKEDEIGRLIESDKEKDKKKLEKLGKSNIIWIYFRNCLNIIFKHNPKPVRISLATLNSSNSKTQEETQKSLFSIEEKILKQLFYSKKITDLPNSRFKKIRNLRKRDVLCLGFSVLTLVLTYLFFNAPLRSKWKYFLLKSDYMTLDSSIISFLNINFFKIDLVWLAIIGFFFVVSTYILLKEGIIIFNFVKDSIKYKKSGIEISSKEGSPLDQYLDEVIYFFEKTKSEIVILEDLDRVGDIDIFIKLKNINNKLNKCEAIKQKVTFIYVMKDSLFENTFERSKFFDYILPIVPQVNSFNSETVLKERLSSDISNDKISDKFIEDISIYIQDMRLLKTICNDYVTYKNRLGKNVVNLEKFFSMMIYKNIFYKDFELLQFDKGGLFEILRSKNNYIKKEIESNNNKIVTYKEKIKKIEEETLISIKEIRKLLIYELTQKIEGISSLYVTINYVGLKELLEDENFEIFRKTNNISCIKNRSKISSGIGFKDIEEAAGFEYAKRIESVNNRQHLDLLYGKIQKLNKQNIEFKSLTSNIELKNLSLKEVLKELESDFIFEKIEKFNTLNIEEQEKQLLVYLLKNGCLDEEYHMYISIFREGSYTKKELMFLQKIRVGRKEEFNYKFNNIDALMKRLREEDFSTKGILNFEILKKLLFNKMISLKEIHKIYLNKFLEHFKEVYFEEYEFIDVFLEDTKMYKGLLRELFQVWENVWQDLVNLDIGENEKKEWLLSLIKYASLEKLKKEIEKSNIREFISGIENDFFKFNTPMNNLISVISACELTFKSIDIPEKKDELFNYLYESHNYNLTFENVRIIIQRIHELPIPELSELLEANYSTLKRIFQEDDPLWIKISKNKNEYIKNVFLDWGGELKDKKEDVIELLRDDKIEIKLRKEILKRERLTYNFSEIPDDLWKDVIALGKVKHSWKNVKGYLEVYEYQGIRNWVEDKLSKLEDIEEFTEEMLKLIILCEETSPKFLENTLVKLEDRFEFEEFPFESAGIKLLEVAIKSNCFIFNKGNYEAIKERNLNLFLDFIRTNFEVFVENLDIYSMGTEEEILFLNSEEFNLNEKINYISVSDPDVRNSDLGGVISQIVKENSYKIDLNEEDKMFLFYKYENSEDRVNFLLENPPEESKELLEWLDSIDEVEIKKSMISFKVEIHRLGEVFELLKERRIVTKKSEKRSTTNIFVFNRTKS
ncbi:P-loop NTPase fold protein [Psychrilyobacter atlanticus]|uniref:YobI family P-loop NTPase n=1 Tax=Psychrilyobacter atlanticus TaxID=271091 RepID=UPI000413CAA3|nr:P-loop NTPase fold protein [Psychrilyobacter atlanticus]